MKSAHPSPDDYYKDLHHAQASLQAARAAVQATGKPVKVEIEILDGPPGAVLLEQSGDAGMVIFGSVGIGRYARSILGSTATDLAEKAHCPVAVIRPHDHTPRHGINWVVVAASDSPDNQTVAEHAMAEAELRRAPVLLIGKQKGLDGEVEAWKARHPDLHIYPVGDGADVARFVKKKDEQVQLAVIGESDAGELAQIIGPHRHPLFNRAESSVLVVRR